MQIETEIIEDVVVLIEQIKRMGIPRIVDEVMVRHWKEQGLSWGWTIGIWLAYAISEGDHRKLPVQEWVRGVRETLEQVTGEHIRETDFTDDRLTIALERLSRDEQWHGIEKGLVQNVIRVYQLKKKTVRVDATTVSGYRDGEETELWRFGHSKDDPALRQIKMMMATLDPLGFPIAMDVVGGEHADDPLYRPVLKRALSYLEEKGLQDECVGHPGSDSSSRARVSDTARTNGGDGQANGRVDRSGSAERGKFGVGLGWRGRREAGDCPRVRIQSNVQL
jgi:transposase